MKLPDLLVRVLEKAVEFDIMEMHKGKDMIRKR